MTARNATGQIEATPQAERSLAPDLARGLTLWFIALANVGSYLYGRPVAGVGGCPVDGDRIDHALDLLVALFVHERSFPLFAVLLGYGLATITHRLTASGMPVGTLKWVLIRRGLGLIVLGAIHAALLFHGDVLGLYGLTSLFVLPLLHRGRVTRAVWIVLSMGLLTQRYASRVAVGTYPSPGVSADYLTAARSRLHEWSLGSGIDAVGLLMLGLVLIGAQLSTSGVLDRPWEHVQVLRRLAVGGLLANGVLNLPYALAVGLIWHPTRSAAHTITALHALSGVPTGLAYLSLFALVAVRLRGRPAGRLRAATEAVGRRSLTCYLLQSVVLAPLLSPWGFGLGAGLDTTRGYLLATVVWGISVAVAVVLARAGRRGPAEVALRAVISPSRVLRAPRSSVDIAHGPTPSMVPATGLDEEASSAMNINSLGGAASLPMALASSSHAGAAAVPRADGTAVKGVTSSTGSGETRTSGQARPAVGTATSASAAHKEAPKHAPLPPMRGLTVTEIRAMLGVAPLPGQTEASAAATTSIISAALKNHD